MCCVVLEYTQVAEYKKKTITKEMLFAGLHNLIGSCWVALS